MRAFTWPLLAGLWAAGCGKDKDEPSDPAEEVDADEDGYASDEDCDDADAAVNPGAAEQCDDIDNNCDGATDEAGATGEATFYADSDGDSYGDAGSTAQGCDAPSGYVAESGDCDDADGDVNPGAAEVCDDADNDCDGATDADDDNAALDTFYFDNDVDGYGDDDATTEGCDAPVDYVAVGGDCDDSDGDAYPGAAELCDGDDNDCDGSEDDGLSFDTYYADDDADGYGDDGATVSSCKFPAGHAVVGGDCDDADAGVSPAASEVCDGEDNDCDGGSDEPGDVTYAEYYQDADGDGYGYSPTGMEACKQPAGYVTIDGDCDDADPALNPAETEICDDLDNDCDGSADESSAAGAPTWYDDDDGDGYGDSGDQLAACDQPAGYVDDALVDCDDTSASINPGESEICDAANADEDCDGQSDDGDASATGQTAWYIDDDGDGSGDDSVSLESCDQPSGYVANTDDPFEDADLAAVLSSGDFEEVTDVAVWADTIYLVGVNSDGDAIVGAYDGASLTGGVLYTGEPLVQPSGVALSEDGSTLYIADVGAETGDAGMSGGVFALSVSGGSPSEIGVSGVIDMPGDVTLAATSGVLLVTGLDEDGEAGVYEVDAMTGAAGVLASGSPLSDPLAIDADAATGAFYVLDSMAADGESALLAFDAGGALTDELATGFSFAFPGGVALDSAHETLFYGTTDAAPLVAVMTDGSASSSGFTSAEIGVPGGMTASDDRVYVTDLSSDAAADLFLFSY